MGEGVGHRRGDGDDPFRVDGAARVHGDASGGEDPAGAGHEASGGCGLPTEPTTLQHRVAGRDSRGGDDGRGTRSGGADGRAGRTIVWGGAH